MNRSGDPFGVLLFEAPLRDGRSDDARSPLELVLCRLDLVAGELLVCLRFDERLSLARIGAGFLATHGTRRLSPASDRFSPCGLPASLPREPAARAQIGSSRASATFAGGTFGFRRLRRRGVSHFANLAFARCIAFSSSLVGTGAAGFISGTASRSCSTASAGASRNGCCPFRNQPRPESADDLPALPVLLITAEPLAAGAGRQCAFGILQRSVVFGGNCALLARLDTEGS